MNDRGACQNIRISATYYNIVADILGRKGERREMPAGATIGDLLAALASESPSFRRLAFTANGQVSGHVRLFCNGRAVLDPGRILADGDEVRVFPAISGG